MFFKNKVKNGKHVYNIENLNIKTNLDCMAFTSLFSINRSSFTPETHDYYYCPDRLTQINFPDCLCNKKLICLRLMNFF